MPAHATEVIREFAVMAVVAPDGTVDITEDITVTAERNKINHGIYRDFPTKYTDGSGRTFNVLFSITDISRNGEKEDYHTASLSNGTRIYIGSKETYVPVGEHTYRIHYKVKRVIGFFNTYDEFYWNVTGNGWDFPIYKARIHMIFPEGANVMQASGYTGPEGDSGSQYRQSSRGNEYWAETTAPLQTNWGLTVAVAFPQGFVTPPDNLDYFIDFLKFHAAWLIYALMTLGLLGYNYMAWWYNGRDVAGAIIPRFDVPDGVSPDLLRYIVRQGYDVKTFSCLLVQAAVKGLVTIEENKHATILSASKKAKFSEATNSSLGVVTNMLAQQQGVVTLPKPSILSGFTEREERQQTALFMQSVQASHSRHLDFYQAQYFNTNTLLKFSPFLLTGLTVLLIWAFSGSVEDTGLAMAVAFFSHAVIIGLFWKPFTKYTKEGQKLADYAGGLKLYLSVAEEARLNTLYPKTITPDTFEKMLPYALALNVEQEWCEYFADLVAAGMVRYDNNGNTGWYHSYHPHGLAHIGNTLGSDLTSVISSASTPPGSSSGSGGGGSSGGGGGGGGGGGW